MGEFQDRLETWTFVFQEAECLQFFCFYNIPVVGVVNRVGIKDTGDV